MTEWCLSLKFLAVAEGTRRTGLGGLRPELVAAGLVLRREEGGGVRDLLRGDGGGGGAGQGSC